MEAELRAAIDARRELGPEYEGELIDGFLERLDRTIDARVDARVAQTAANRPAPRGMDGSQLALAIVTTVVAIPLTAITVVFEADALALVVWVGIVAVNLAAALSRRR